MTHPNKKISIWLLTSAFLVFLIVIIGGLTRLTESGLSITYWKPISGILPPLSEGKWQEEFSLYTSSPQYLKVNVGMSMDEFKYIYIWEYLHRNIGRLIGLFFFIPFVYFYLKKQTAPHTPKLFAILCLIGFQGFLGWWMVASGLIDDPRVSHYRLAAHLSTALIIMSLMIWYGLTFLQIPTNNRNSKQTKTINIAIVVTFLQIVYGAFIAGLDGGLTYNTWPLMDGDFVPAGFAANGFYSLVSDIISIQFIHRWWAFVVLFFVIKIFIQTRPDLILNPKITKHIKFASNSLVLLVALQIIIGIATLVYVVPVPLASLHQAMAALLLANLIYLKKIYS